MEYILVKDVDESCFSEIMMKYLNDGWTLHGSPSCAYNTKYECLEFVQAIVRE